MAKDGFSWMQAAFFFESLFQVAADALCVMKDTLLAFRPHEIGMEASLQPDLLSVSAVLAARSPWPVALHQADRATLCPFSACRSCAAQAEALGDGPPDEIFYEVLVRKSGCRILVRTGSQALLHGLCYGRAPQAARAALQQLRTDSLRTWRSAAVKDFEESWLVTSRWWLMAEMCGAGWNVLDSPLQLMDPVPCD